MVEAISDRSNPHHRPPLLHSDNGGGGECGELFARETLPLVTVEEISQTIDSENFTVQNSVLFSGPLATTSLSTNAKFEVPSPKRVQGESFLLPISKKKASPLQNLSNVKKTPPERRRTTPLRGAGGGHQGENSKPINQHRWPARMRQPNPLSRSSDWTVEKVEKKKLAGSGSMVHRRLLSTE